MQGGQGGTIFREPNHCGAPQSTNNVASTFFNTVHLLPKDLRFEHGCTKLVSCPGRHLTSVRLWQGSYYQNDSAYLTFESNSCAWGLQQRWPESHFQTLTRVVRLAFFRPNFRNLASFQVGWPKKKYLAFWPFFGLIWTWLALKNSFGFLALFWPFYSEKVFFRQHIYKTFVRNTMLDGRLRSDIIKIWDARFEIIFCLITGNVCKIAV